MSAQTLPTLPASFPGTDAAQLAQGDERARYILSHAHRVWAGRFVSLYVRSSELRPQEVALPPFAARAAAVFVCAVAGRAPGAERGGDGLALRSWFLERAARSRALEESLQKWCAARARELGRGDGELPPSLRAYLEARAGHGAAPGGPGDGWAELVAQLADPRADPHALAARILERLNASLAKGELADSYVAAAALLDLLDSRS